MKHSAGLLVFRRSGNSVEVLLVHPGGPFWGKKDFWSIPKGELKVNEDPIAGAKREFKEETGFEPPSGELLELGSSSQTGGIKQAGGKTNTIWATEGNFDVTEFKCNTFTMEWPPKSGKIQEFPECDRAAWLDLATAKRKLFKSQTIFVDRLAEHLKIELPEEPEQQTLI